MDEVANSLIGWFQAPSYVVALSGGVDSGVVLKAASLSQKSFVAVTAVSDSTPSQDQHDAIQLCDALGIQHHEIRTQELTQEAYRRNDARRCYYCKSTLFQAIQKRFPEGLIVTGTNRDDLGDYRPGLEAAAESNVRAPLAELGITKEVVRQLAAYWGLPKLASKPASPCLASRLAYGVPVTAERLQMIQSAEDFLREHGFHELRVRFHDGAHARIEISLSDMDRLISLRQVVTEQFHALGFQIVTVDMDGFRSGNLNRLIQIS